MFPFNQEELILILIVQLIDFIPFALVYLKQEYSLVFESLVSQNKEFPKQVNAGFYVPHTENFIHFYFLLWVKAYN